MNNKYSVASTYRPTRYACTVHPAVRQTVLRLAWYMRPIQFENSIRNRIGRPIRFEIRFERKKDDSQLLTLNCIKSFYRSLMGCCVNSSHWLHFQWPQVTLDTSFRDLRFKNQISRKQFHFHPQLLLNNYTSMYCCNVAAKVTDYQQDVSSAILNCQRVQ